jgi:predicted GIY-YIG superfamily endonuclease
LAELYLLHFKKPYWNKCQHYVGITKFTAEERCAVHRGNKEGRPSKLVQYALRNGNDFVVAHVEKFNSDSEARQREKQIKRNGHFSKLCPVCRHEEIHRRFRQEFFDRVEGILAGKENE